MAIAETLHAETLARVTAAERAKRACESRLEELGATWRIARQQQVTTEILEAVAGREAAGG